MKQEILSKLFNSEELTSDELIYIGKNLNDSVPALKFNHEDEDSLAACSIQKKSVSKMNDEFSEIMKNIDDKKMSIIVEEVEKMVLKNEEFLRLVIIQCVKASMLHQAGASGFGASEDTGGIGSLLAKLLRSRMKDDPNKDDKKDE